MIGEPLAYLHGHATRLSPEGDYEVNDEGCWIWQRGTVDGTRDSYGSLGRDGEQLAHRWYYRQLVGPIPVDHVLHHTCETPACVNPAHLEPLTRDEHRRLHIQLAQASGMT